MSLGGQRQPELPTDLESLKLCAERPGGPSSVCQFVQVRRQVGLGEDVRHQEHEDARIEPHKDCNILSFLRRHCFSVKMKGMKRKPVQDTAEI